VCGLSGAVFKLWFQFWAMGSNWPMNVGGKPWNSLPAYVPVTFEVMVLLAGLGVVLAFFIRSGLYLGKPATPLFGGVTDNRFVLALEAAGKTFDGGAARELFHEFHAISVEEREG
jgi:hypothetical protein